MASRRSATGSSRSPGALARTEGSSRAGRSRSMGSQPKPTSFEVTFDRPVDPQALLNMGQGTFTAGDVQVFYHDTNNGDAPIPLMVTSVAPIQPPDYVTDPTLNGVDGYTKFLVTFDPDQKPDGSASGITDFTGTYSYVVAPDNGQGSATPTAIAAPIWSFATAPQPQPVINPATDPNATVSPNLPIPTWGPGGSNTGFDYTTSYDHSLGLQQSDDQWADRQPEHRPIRATAIWAIWPSCSVAPNGSVAPRSTTSPETPTPNFTNVTFLGSGGAVDPARERTV